MERGRRGRTAHPPRAGERGSRRAKAIVIGAALGAATGVFVAIGVGSALLLIQSIAIIAGTYATSDALGPLGVALYALILLSPAVPIGALLGAAIGLLVAARVPYTVR